MSFDMLPPFPRTRFYCGPEPGQEGIFRAGPRTREDGVQRANAATRMRCRPTADIHRSSDRPAHPADIGPTDKGMGDPLPSSSVPCRVARDKGPRSMVAGTPVRPPWQGIRDGGRGSDRGSGRSRHRRLPRGEAFDAGAGAVASQQCLRPGIPRCLRPRLSGSGGSATRARRRPGRSATPLQPIPASTWPFRCRQSRRRRRQS